MAANVSSCLEMELEDISLETTVSTTQDVSLSAEQPGHAQKVTRQLMERKLHSVQLLKIQLSQKNLIIDNMWANYLSKVKELNDALLQNQLIALKLDGQLKQAQEESRKQQALLRQEMEDILCEKAGELRRSLRDLDISQDKYQELCDLPQETISIQDYVAMRVYEVVTPLQAQLAELRVKRASLTEELETQRSQMKALMDSYEEERWLRTQLDLKSQRLALDLADTRQLIQEGDYQRDHYPRIKRERDIFEAELKAVRKRLENLDLAHSALTRERDALSKEVMKLQHSVTLLQKDKESLRRQNIELSVQHAHEEEHLVRLQEQLEEMKKAKEDACGKHQQSQDHFKSEYETKLREEIEDIRLKTRQEMEQLQRTSREMYEREARNLREARDNVALEKERAEREARSRYEQLLEQFRQLQLGSDGRIAELSTQAKLHALQAEHAQMVKNETAKALAQCQAQCERQQKKVELLTQEFYRLQTSSEQRVAALQAQNAERAPRSEKNGKPEEEPDRVTLQAAELEYEEEAERVSFSFGYGTNVPAAAKRRLKQSTGLARRVLQLERQNAPPMAELERHQSGWIHEEPLAANQLSEQTQQPYRYLIEIMRQKDEQISTLKERLKSLEDHVSSLRKERSTLQQVKSNMAVDLEKLLNHRKELTMMKKVLISMRSRQQDAGNPLEKHAAALESCAEGKHHPSTTEEESAHKPEPTVVTVVTQRDACDCES